MSGYRTHLRAGLVAHALLVAGCLVAVATGISRLALLAAGTGLPLTLAGALAPDVDHPASKGYVLVVRLVPVVVAGVVAVGLYHSLDLLLMLAAALPLSSPSAFVAGVLYVIAVLVTWRSITEVVIALRPSHRTVTHRIPTWLVVALVVGGGLVALYTWLAIPRPMLVAAVHTGAILAGAISHLYCDGLLTERATYAIASRDHWDRS